MAAGTQLVANKNLRQIGDQIVIGLNLGKFFLLRFHCHREEGDN
jgi:hypothetical protein